MGQELICGLEAREITFRLYKGRKEMKMQNGMKRFFEERARYWYIVAAFFVVLGIADYGFLSIVIPLWACNIIMIVLIILATAYIAIMYNLSLIHS